MIAHDDSRDGKEGETMFSLGERLKYAREARGLTQTQLAEAVGQHQSTLAHWERGKARPSPDKVDMMAPVLGVATEWLLYGRGSGPDMSRVPPRVEPARAAGGQPMAATEFAPRIRPGSELVGERDLPVYASAQGGPDGMTINYDPIEYVKRPEPLMQVRGAFGFYLVGDSMSPKYEHGDLLLVHPTRPPGRRDGVLIIKRGDGGHTHDALVKLFVGWRDDGLMVEQFNPALQFTIPRDQVHGVHQIVGVYHGRG
jgi:phage repressor protein C with HTH and peptisase S24 domain